MPTLALVKLVLIRSVVERQYIFFVRVSFSVTVQGIEDKVR